MAALFRTFKEPLALLGLILVVNFILICIGGNYLLRAIFFPYANYFIKSRLDSAINRTFAKEFSRLIELVHKILRIMAE